MTALVSGIGDDSCPRRMPLTAVMLSALQGGGAQHAFDSALPQT